MTVSKARKILGKVADKMTDEELVRTISTLEEIAKWQLRNLKDNSINAKH